MTSSSLLLGNARAVFPHHEEEIIVDAEKGTFFSTATSTTTAMAMFAEPRGKQARCAHLRLTRCASNSKRQDHHRHRCLAPLRLAQQREERALILCRVAYQLKSNLTLLASIDKGWPADTERARAKQTPQKMLLTPVNSNSRRMSATVRRCNGSCVFK